MARCGGDPGFISPAGPTTLRLPIDPGSDWCADERRAGICIPDLDSGQVLHLTGHVRAGAAARQREFDVSHWILRDMPRLMDWER